VKEIKMIGDFLKQLRLEAKMNLREAAEKSGLSHSYIRYLEIGERPGTDTAINPTPETLKKLATAYNYPYLDLLEKAGYIDELSEERKKEANETTLESFIDSWFDPQLAELTYKNGENRIHDYVLHDLIGLKKKYERLFDDDSVTPSSFIDAFQKCRNAIEKFRFFNDIGSLAAKMKGQEKKLEDLMQYPVLSFQGEFLTDLEREKITDFTEKLIKERVKNHS
jgi:transcriptional regulator with XRE-family HTH domain